MKPFLNDILAREEIRQYSYFLLSKSYSIPEKNTLMYVAHLENLAACEFSEATIHASEMGEELKNMDGVESLKVDYSKLFIGPFSLLVPPYGSMYLEEGRKIMGDSTLDVRNRYKEVGVDISVAFKEPPDHIVAELEFMHYLIIKEIEAIKKGDLKKAIQYLKKQKGFLMTHLGVWIFEFTSNIEAKAETQFYKHLAKFTKIFIKKDRDDILETSLTELLNNS